VPPCRFADGRLRTFYHSDYFRSVVRHDDVPEFSDEERELLDLYEEIANDPAWYLDMELEPGDIQLVSNHTVLHARTAYEDHADPAEKRHLLRLWLSIEAD
jgi:alpha-ketoglutarate-dependent taurine dioxygenase